MQRRDFLKSTVSVAVARQLAARKAEGKVPAHLWGNYDFGSGPPVTDRLNQGPFPQYPPDAIISHDQVVMTTTPSDQVVPNYGKGLVTYITADNPRSGSVSVQTKGLYSRQSRKENGHDAWERQLLEKVVRHVLHLRGT